MRTFFFIAILNIIHISVFAQQIEFFNVGWQDKPLDNIIISTQKKTDGYFVKNEVVSEKAYNYIRQYVVDNNTYNKPLSSKYNKDINSCSGSYNFGCYAIQITEPQDSLLYFMDTNEITVKFF